MSESSPNAYFVKEVFFTSDDPAWPIKYLQNRDQRVTAILSPFLGNAFWENYAKVRLQFEREGWLVLRVKSITNDFVCFTQAWISEDFAERFREQALRGVNMMRILETQGIHSKEQTYFSDHAGVQELISKVRTRQHILQVVAEPWRTADMKIGDPMKVGKLYLPFPD